MAIRRCPYCKAIIDEQDKYCNNCGTQLLFPEDEFVEEEIPGDKIVDKGESKEEEIEAKGDEEELEEREESEEEEDEEEEIEEEEKEELEEEEEGEEEEESEELEEPEEEEEEILSEKDKDEKDQLEREAEAVLGEAEPDQEEEIEEPGEEIEKGEPIEKAVRVAEPHKKYHVSIEEDELVFKTKDLENLTRTVDEGKAKVEEFLASRSSEKPKAVTPHEVPSLFQEGEEPGSTTKEILPPWASGMKESPPATANLEEIVDKGTKEAAGTGQAPTGPGWTKDSGIGIPEKVTPAGLPFGTAEVPAAAMEKEEVTEEEETVQPGAEPGRRTGFSLKLKSKLVDLAFITALWLITLWFTAQVIGVSFLRVITGSLVPVLALYFILLVLYFFLFLYFLGETLGDHYFSEED
jgi:hypothetical protein